VALKQVFGRSRSLALSLLPQAARAAMAVWRDEGQGAPSQTVVRSEPRDVCRKVEVRGKPENVQVNAQT